jgi:murein L,D-transpeptidase YafK
MSAPSEPRCYLYQKLTMHKLTIIILCLFVTLFPVKTFCIDIPSSSRSINAISRVKPRLEKDFSDKGLSWGAPIFIRIFKQTKELEIWCKDDNNKRIRNMVQRRQQLQTF